MNASSSSPPGEDVHVAAVERISVIGLGKLGLCLAAVLADSGFEVVGIDTNPEKVNSVASGRSPIYEPGLDDLLKSVRNKLVATTEGVDAIRGSDATFIVVPTPSKNSGEFSLRYVRAAIQEVGRVLAKKQGYHLVVINSTVTPGSMDKVILPALERVSGKKVNKDFGLCYNPEFIALGDVLRGLRQPDFILAGESDETAGNALKRIHKRVCTNGAPVERMSFINAEVAKMAVNSFVTMKMSFANTLAEICERLPTGDVDKITHAIGLDRRVGSAYLRGGMGYGGPCFPRDNTAFAAFAKKIGVDAELARATDRTNRRQMRRIIELIQDRFAPVSTRIGVLGVTYKPKTDITEASQALMLAEALAVKGFEVHVFDPAVTRGNITRSLVLERNVEDCLKNSDVCIIATPWDGFSKIQQREFSNKIVVDCWRILNGNKPRDESHYIALGHDMISRRLAQSARLKTA